MLSQGFVQVILEQFPGLGPRCVRIVTLAILLQYIIIALFSCELLLICDCA